ncbi:male sterility protein-domain-containing protein [Lipomyces doorenjongii]|uniref:male sterility protein-domain-containing protein n=1 Tax=Lipomyces doorenjongii TaxID=383834 RepID=UPI0034CE2FCF
MALPPEQVAKIAAYPSDFSRPDLGLPSDVYNNLLSTLTTVIHSAWAVKFNFGIKSFEQHHINGTHYFDPALSRREDHFSSGVLFLLVDLHGRRPVLKFEHAQNMGYAKSKLVTEHIVERASEQYGLHARVIRIGQIVGDSVNGHWNDTKAIPLMIRSALMLKALPALDETPSWIPVDYVARSLMELCGIVNPIPNDIPQTTFRWTEDLLPPLQSRPPLPHRQQREWIRLVREGDQDPIRNPTVKLAGFFAAKYDNELSGRKGLAFETNVTEKNSDAIRNATDPVSSGLIKKFVERWLEAWV